MKIVGKDLGSLLKEIAALSTQFDVFQFLKNSTERVAMRAFMVMRIPGATTKDIQSFPVINNWPAEMLAKFEAEDLINNGYFAARLRSSTLPFTLDVSDVSFLRQDEKSQIMIDLFIRYKMTRAGYFPVCGPLGERGCINFSGDRPTFTEQEMLQLLMVSAHIFERILAIGFKDTPSDEELSEREIDCLRWTAAGKTSIDIALILNLSEHTVNHYLARATKKLNSVNRTQAVARALRIGIIN